MDDLTAALDRRIRREARANPPHPIYSYAVRGLLVVVLVALGFLLGAAYQRATVPSSEVLVRKGDASKAYFLPVKSRQLTVTLVPLVPSSRIEKLLLRDGPMESIARQLAGEGGLQAAAADLRSIYPLGFSVGKAQVLPDELFDEMRQQYNTERTLTWLAAHTAPGSFRTVGVLYADLYVAGFNYLFGQARLGGSICICSTARLAKPGGRKTPRQRFAAIAAHELGHTLGLQHNKDRRSIMAFANSLDEHDTQGETLLTSDWKTLRQLHPIEWHK